jgi:AraC-like DNA-binding protein
MTEPASILDSAGKASSSGRLVAEKSVDTRKTGPGEDRQQWAQAITQTFCRMDAQWQDRQMPFSGRLCTRESGRLQISTVTAGPHQAIRTPEMIESEEDFFISLVTHGHGEVRQGRHGVNLSDGAFTIVDGSRPFLFSFPVPFQQIIIRVPREDFIARLPKTRLDRALGLMLPGHSGISSVVSAVFRQAAQLDDSVDHAAETAVSLSALDMLAAVLHGAMGPTSDTALAHHQDLQRAQACLIAHLHDPDWTLEATSSELNMSPRYMSQLFAEQGLTPASWWMQTRLERALRLLQTQRITAREASERTGFKDPAHFSRAFRKWHGTPPGQVQPLGTKELHS